MNRALILLLGVFVCTIVAYTIVVAAGAAHAGEVDHAIDPADKKSGYAFLNADTQALQDDDFANPGFLWVDRGRELFASSDNGAKACVSCHESPQTSLGDAATRYPAIDEASGTLVNLEGRINLCRTRYQEAAPLDYESDALLSLTAYVANLSRGRPVAVSLSEQMKADYDRGRTYFLTRRGQLNLSCRHCHDLNWGRKLRGDTISQGHGTGFPAYRLEWQAVGSLHRRFRDCDVGVRAAPMTPGSEIYTALELYLAVRAQGLAVETPAVRR